MAASAFAVEAEIDGLWYELISKAKEATVIQYKNNHYSGNIVIPETVEYNGANYSVTSIGSHTFYGCSGIMHYGFKGSTIIIYASSFWQNHPNS